jgi:hypothetical protein
MLTGQVLNAKEAKDIGLVAELMPRDNVIARAWELAEQLATKSDMLLRYTRAVLRIHCANSSTRDCSIFSAWKRSRRSTRRSDRDWSCKRLKADLPDGSNDSPLCRTGLEARAHSRAILARRRFLIAYEALLCLL